MFAVFKGSSSNRAPWDGAEQTPFVQAGVELGGGGRASQGEGDLHRLALRGAAFGHWLSATDVSWAAVTTPDTGLKVHLALCGEIENEAEIAELYNVSEGEGDPRAQDKVVGPSALHSSSSGPSNFSTSTSSSAKLLLDLYWKGFSDAYGDYSAQPETCLASLQGCWSFCLYDESSGYILVAASKEPSPGTTLYWAQCPTTGDVCVTTESLRDLLDQSTMGAFPRAHYYVKSLCSPQGELTSFWPKIPQQDAETEQAAWCGQVFRVASGSDIAGLVGSGADVQAQ